VAIGAHDVLRRLLDAEPGERLSADVVEDAGCRFASETVHRDEAGVVLAQAGELIVVPPLARSTEQEVVRRRGECFLQPTLAPVLDNVGVWEPIPGLRPAAERRLALVDGWAASVLDAQLGEGAEAEGTQPGEAEDVDTNRGAICVLTRRISGDPRSRSRWRGP
jgi:hypothetical protein